MFNPYQIRDHAYGADPVVRTSHRYLDNAKAEISHAVRCYGQSVNTISILGPKGEVYTLNSLLEWVVTPRL